MVGQRRTVVRTRSSESLQHARQPALVRRRGTRDKNKGELIQSVYGGVLLLVAGLLAGLFIGVVVMTPSTPDMVQGVGQNEGLNAESLPKVERAGVDSMLRASANAAGAFRDKFNNYRNHPVNPAVESEHDRQQARNAVGSVSKSTKEFISHAPIIGTKGPFPYYPGGDRNNLVDPNHDFTTFQPPGGYRFDEYKNGDSPYSYNPGESDDLARSRRIHVKHAMQHAWKSYSTYAWGQDEVLPQTKSGHNNWGGMGTTMIDSLDTLWLMNMTDEFYHARDWVKDSLNHNIPKAVSVFETTIRSLGGLLSAYDWSGDRVFLNQAKDLGKRLFGAFENPTGIPYGQINLATGKSNNIGWTGGNAITAEFGTLQIEFRMLARLSGIHEYKRKSEYVFDILKDLSRPDGLYPYFVRNRGHKPEFANDKITFGAMGDSLYEYMLKIWIQGGKTETMYREMYDKAIQGMHDNLLQVSTPSGLVFIADRNNGRLDTKMDHLVCFMGGLLALGAYTDPFGLQSERAQRDLKTGKALTYTCYQMYARMNTGISAEFVQFYPEKDFEIGRGAPHYLLRPETVESFFVLSQLTGDPVYREWGWEVFQAIERYCKVEGGYGSLRDVQNTDGSPQNKMESFFLAETLKYLYLLFDPDTQVDILHKHVFNTEAHPVRTFPSMDADGETSRLT